MLDKLSAMLFYQITRCLYTILEISTEEFLESYRGVNGLVIKFESMVSNKMGIDRTTEYIGVKKPDPSILDRKIASPKLKKNFVRRKLAFYDRFIISAMGSKLLSRLGYE